MHIQSELLKSIPWIKHGFFSKQGGVSYGIYESLNCGPGSDDNPEAVLENRKRCAKELIGIERDLLTCFQIHSNRALFVNKPFTERPKADALVTNSDQLPIGILTADCTPILFADTKTRIIGAAHAGWKGALSGIIENTLAHMVEQGASMHNIVAVAGPSIAQNSYEVSDDFVQNFLKESSGNKKYFIPSDREGHALFDLKAFVKDRLKALRLKEIEISQIDTYANADLYFSYRRKCHFKEADYGRQFSGIAILD